MLTVRCPSCNNPVPLTEEDAAEVVCSTCGSSFALKQERTRTLVQQIHQLGRFELIEEVGAGAFGAVWKGGRPELGRVVAIKVPHAGRLMSSREADRFLREARSTAQLRHPGIVAVHEVGNQDGLTYLVEDFIDGVTLADLVKVRKFAPRVAAELVAHVADAIAYAHSMGVIHRDVKPSNIMLERSTAETGKTVDDPTAWPCRSLFFDCV